MMPTEGITANPQLTDERVEPRRLDQLQSVDWFASQPRSGSNGSATSIIARSAIATLAGVLLGLIFSKWIMGLCVIAIAIGVGWASLASSIARVAVDRAFAWLGETLGTLFSWILLTPIFLVGFTLARAWMRLSRADPLQLRRTTLPTYWLSADTQERKLRFVSAMFAGERVQTRGLPATAVLGLLLAALLLGEGLLRIWGFGSPVLYVADPQAGYYPAPHQSVGRYRGRVYINAYGMRSPDYPARKPVGVFRVLMIGDSTLYGGSYVDQGELYSNLLERALASAASSRPVQVMAIGVNAWGPFNELGYVDKFGTFDADLVLIDLPIEDIYRPLARLYAVPFFRADRPPRLAFEEVFDHLAWRARVHVYGPPTSAERAWDGKAGIEAYARLVQRFRSQGAEVMVEVLPSQAAGTTGSIAPKEQADMERLRRAVSSPVIVSYPAGLFRSAGEHIYHDWTHLDVTGHRAYADFLRSEITTRSQAWARWIHPIGATASARVLR
jgi:hypothetical protein